MSSYARFQGMLAAAAAEEARYELVDVDHCSRHRSTPLQQNWVGLWVCTDRECVVQRQEEGAS